MQAALDEQRVVGAVTIVSHWGEILYRRGHGYANRESGKPICEDTLFRLASLTKPIVTVATLRLVADGRLSLDDPITHWLPEFRPRLPDGCQPALSVHRLLTHTAGLSYGLMEETRSTFRTRGISDGLDRVDFDLRENLRRLASVPLAFRPGAAWRYSLALDVLGAVIECVTSLPLGDAVADLVSAPLGMNDTGFVSRSPGRFAMPYVNGSPVPSRMAENEDVPLPKGHGTSIRLAPSRIFDARAFPSGGAGMYSSADDMWRVLEAIRVGDFLPASLMEAMRVDHTPAGTETSGPGWGFGYGGSVLVDPNRAETPQSVGTLQWGGVYGHSWFIDSARGLTVLLMTNTAFEGLSGRLVVDVRDAVYDELS